MFAGEIKAYGPDDGVVSVERFTVHEWRRANDEGEELVMREWTEPGDGAEGGFLSDVEFLPDGAEAGEDA
jgi:hypothetical protein